MKKLHVLSLLFSVLCSVAASAVDLSLCTFNIRREGTELNRNRRWVNRFPAVKDFLNSYRPTVIGFQEAVKTQIAHISGHLSNYGWVGVTRGSSILGFAADEAVPLFYDKNKLTLLQSGTFSIMPKSWWPSESGWINRICTWGYFESKEDGRRFYVFNTHLDHMYDQVRINQLEILLEQMNVLVQDRSVPVFLMGDFNTDLTPRVAHLLNAFDNLRARAVEVQGPSLTHASWGNGGSSRIDHILVKLGSSLRIPKFITVAEAQGVTLSDHRPVIAQVQW